jgi:hypothetical protein
MGKMKELAMEQQEEQERANIEEEAKAQQEAYYYYVIQEFYAICKHFGTTKVMEDLKRFKETVEKPKEESRIFVAHP